MKIALVNLTKNEPSYGLVLLATFLRERGGYDRIRIIDANFEDVLEEIVSSRPDIVGISAMTIYYHQAIDLAEEIRKRYSPTIILGGVHISVLPESLKPCFDVGVIGEGEETTLELVNAIRDNKKTEGIKGTVYFKDKRIIVEERRELIRELDFLPLPDWSYIDKRYFNKRYAFGKMRKAGAMMTSRGCPYKCIFCSTSRFWQSFRMFGVKRICDEIEMLHKRWGVEVITPLDDMFTVNTARVEQITAELGKRGLLGKVIFTSTGRVNMLDDKMCLALKRLNVRQLNFGFESGNQRVLTYLGKEGVTVEKIKKAVRLCNRYGIEVSGSFIFGTPTETPEEMGDTLNLMRWLVREKATDLWSFTMTPFPGTPIWEIAKKRGKVSDEMDWEKLTMHASEHPLLLEDEIDPKQFKEIYLKSKELTRPLEKRYWRNRILGDPFGSGLYALKNIKKAVKFLFSRDYMRGS